MKNIIFAACVAILGILLIGTVQAQTITATINAECLPMPYTFVVPAGQTAVNFVVQDLKAGVTCGPGVGGLQISSYGWSIYLGNIYGQGSYSFSSDVNSYGERVISEPYGKLDTLSLGPGTYTAYVNGGRLARVIVNYDLI